MKGGGKRDPGGVLGAWTTSVRRKNLQKIALEGISVEKPDVSEVPT